MSSENGRKPRIGVFKLASCDGCQLSLLDVEEELMAVVEAVELAYFPEASRRMLPGPYDIGLVEGSVTTHHDATRIQQIRRQCRKLVAIGACATAGGIQALRNWREVDQLVHYVYPTPAYIDTLRTSSPIAEHVPVDFELRGCPINKRHLIELLSAVIVGRKPNIPTHSLCIECKRQGLVCVAVARGAPCLGPVTQAGCGAICPAFGRGCYGCFGPMEAPNSEAMADLLRAAGHDRDDVVRRFRTFNAWAWQFRQATEEREKP